jgi:hypothetical protein
MINSDQVDLWAYENFVFYGYAAPIHEFETMINEDVFPDPNVLAEVRVEGWEHPERRIHWHAGKSRE